MPIIEIVKPFLLKSDDNKLTEYKVGRYDVEQEVADHWYVQAHLKGFVEPPPRVGTEQQAVLLAQQAARLAEPVEDQTQKPAEPPPHEKAVPEITFAGRRRNLPEEVDPMPSFVDPRTK